MVQLLSVIIPNHNGARTIEKCLAAAFASQHDNFEVIVVDDGSTDGSTETIKKFPCRLIALSEHSGASRARNIGAEQAKGDILFFLDADCLLKEDALATAAAAIAAAAPGTVIGGTYTLMPYDKNFFSIFQSVYIHYSETKNLENPDYIATHAMVIPAAAFKNSGGFNENFLPIIEDVEFSHRLRRLGFRLLMNPDILVQHIFNFSFAKSIRNAIKKSKYWTIYSINNKDLLSDSGTASVEFKVNVVSWFLSLLLILLGFAMQTPTVFGLVLPVLGFNLFLNKRLFRAFYKTRGLSFALSASFYYTLLYPLAVGAGATAGLISHGLGMYR